MKIIETIYKAWCRVLFLLIPYELYLMLSTSPYVGVDVFFYTLLSPLIKWIIIFLCLKGVRFAIRKIYEMEETKNE